MGYKSPGRQVAEEMLRHRTLKWEHGGKTEYFRLFDAPRNIVDWAAGEYDIGPALTGGYPTDHNWKIYGGGGDKYIDIAFTNKGLDVMISSSGEGMVRREFITYEQLFNSKEIELIDSDKVFNVALYAKYHELPEPKPQDAKSQPEKYPGAKPQPKPFEGAIPVDNPDEIKPQPKPTPYEAPDSKLGQEISMGDLFRQHYSQPLAYRYTYGWWYVVGWWYDTGWKPEVPHIAYSWQQIYSDGMTYTAHFNQYGWDYNKSNFNCTDETFFTEEANSYRRYCGRLFSGPQEFRLK
jgi:hypothetical protein